MKRMAGAWVVDTDQVTPPDTVTLHGFLQKGDLMTPAALTRRAGLSPADVTDLLIGADVVVSNDSGIAHVGGLLGVPTVCVHAGSLTHEFLFASAPSVASVVNPDGKYSGDSDLPALQAITPAAVLRTIEDVFVLAKAARRWIERPLRAGRSTFKPGSPVVLKAGAIRPASGARRGSV